MMRVLTWIGAWWVASTLALLGLILWRWASRLPLHRTRPLEQSDMRCGNCTRPGTFQVLFADRTSRICSDCARAVVEARAIFQELAIREQRKR